MDKERIDFIEESETEGRNLKLTREEALKEVTNSINKGSVIKIIIKKSHL